MSSTLPTASPSPSPGSPLSVAVPGTAVSPSTQQVRQLQLTKLEKTLVAGMGIESDSATTACPSSLMDNSGLRDLVPDTAPFRTFFCFKKKSPKPHHSHVLQHEPSQRSSNARERG